MRTFNELKVLLLTKNEPSLNQLPFRVVFPVQEPLGSKGWFPFRLGVHILGGDFTSHLNKELRVKRGLTYGARISVDYGNPFPGLGIVTTYTKPQDVTIAWDLIFEAIDKIRDEGPPPLDVAAFKKKIVNKRAFLFETVNGIIGQFLLLSLNGLPTDFVTNYEANIERAKSHEIQTAIQNAFSPAHSRIVVVGRESDLEALAAWTKTKKGSLTVLSADKVLVSESW